MIIRQRFPENLNEIDSSENIENVYYYNNFDKEGEELKNSYVEFIQSESISEAKEKFINARLQEQGMSNQEPSGENYSWDKEEKTAYYIDEEVGKILFVFGKNTICVMGKNTICVTVNIEDFNSVGAIAFEYDQNKMYEAFYDTSGNREVFISSEYYLGVPFPIVLENESMLTNIKNSFAHDVLMRHERFLFYSSGIESDENGEIIAYDNCLYHKWFNESESNHKAIMDYGVENRFSKLTEELFDEEHIDYYLDKNSSGFLDVSYQENNHPSLVEHSFSSVSHGSFDDSGKTHYDEYGRMIYRDYYHTSGNYSETFFYAKDSKRPWATVSVKGAPKGGGDGFAFGMETEVFMFPDALNGKNFFISDKI